MGNKHKYQQSRLRKRTFRGNQYLEGEQFQGDEVDRVAVVGEMPMQPRKHCAEAVRTRQSISSS